jgi:hypothetical protein
MYIMMGQPSSLFFVMTRHNLSEVYDEQLCAAKVHTLSDGESR